jgi:cytochrome c5
MKKQVILVIMLCVGAKYGLAQTATAPAVAPNAASQARQPEPAKKRHRKQNQETAVAPASEADNHSRRVDEMVNKLAQEKVQLDPGHPPTASDIQDWKKRLNEGEDFLTLERGIKTAIPVPVQSADPDAPKFDFGGATTYDYGEILESNDPTPHDFKFVNSGKKPLIIQEAHGSCGCTVPTYSKEPVMPGAEGVITVKYSSRGRVGPISKDVTITSNANPSPVFLHITGTVKANPEFATPASKTTTH